MNLLIITASSIVAIIGGNLVLLAAVFAITRRGTTPQAAAQIEHDSDSPQESVVIAMDYEAEARPVRLPVYETPVNVRGAVDDSFVELLDDVPSRAAVGEIERFPGAPPHREESLRERQAVGRAEPIGRAPSRPTKPLPMPVAPPNIEPIPELEPTELMVHRPDWAADWP